MPVGVFTRSRFPDPRFGAAFFDFDFDFDFDFEVAEADFAAVPRVLEEVFAAARPRDFRAPAPAPRFDFPAPGRFFDVRLDAMLVLPKNLVGPKAHQDDSLGRGAGSASGTRPRRSSLFYASSSSSSFFIPDRPVEPVEPDAPRPPSSREEAPREDESGLSEPVRPP